MSTKRKILWWIEDRRPFAWLSLFSVLFLVTLSFDLVWQKHHPRELSIEAEYILCVAAALLAFQKMSCELSEMAWIEPLRLLPGFSRALRLGVLRCVALLSIIGALSSLLTQDWLPWVAISYAAAVLAGLHLPVWITPRRDTNISSVSLKETGQNGMNWPTLVSFTIPLLALHYVLQTTVLVGMTASVPILLHLMWRRIPGAPGLTPRTPTGNLLRTPSTLVVATVLLLLLSANLFHWNEWKDRFNLGWILIILPFMGLSAMGRQGLELRVLLGRFWLLGMSRAQLCRTGMWRLFLALASEYAIYLSVILVEVFLGRIEWHVFVHLILVIMLYALMNWSQAATELLEGITPFKGQFTKNPIVIVLCMPAVVVTLWGVTLTWYGLLAGLCAIGAIPWLVRDYMQSFEKIELW